MVFALRRCRQPAEPEVADMIPDRIRIVVLLPAPLGPEGQQLLPIDRKIDFVDRSQGQVLAGEILTRILGAVP